MREARIDADDRGAVVAERRRAPLEMVRSAECHNGVADVARGLIKRDAFSFGRICVCVCAEYLFSSVSTRGLSLTYTLLMSRVV